MTEAASELPVLVIEDEALIAEYMRDVLEGTRYVVIGVAPSAEHAVVLAEEHRPTLALVDVNLHGRRDGIDLASELQERLGVRCIFVTGSGDPVTMDRIRAVGAAGLVRKPFRSAGLLAALDAACGGIA